MANMSAFDGMKRHGRQVLKFEQAAHLSALAAAEGQNPAVNLIQSVENGICAALSAAWLREKIKGSNALFLGLGRLNKFDGKFFRRSDSHVRRLIQRYAPDQATYAQHSGDMTHLFDAHGLDLSPDNSVGEPPGGRSRLEYYMVRYTRNHEVLARGRGVYLGIKLGSAGKLEGHACAIYKSNSTSCYFFDPNVGVYEVLEPEQFIRAWVQGYAANGKTVCNPDFALCGPA